MAIGIQIAGGGVLQRVLSYGVAGAALVAGAIALEDRRMLAGRWLVPLGGASYALYLCHQPVYAALGYWWRAHKAYPDAMWSLKIGTAVAVSLVWYVCFERRALDWFRDLFARRPVVRASAALE